MTSLPKTMRAIHQPDPKSTLLTLTQDPLPVSTDPQNDYLIRVMAASPCLGELHWETRFPQMFDPNRERVPGTECAGIVVALPPSPSADSAAATASSGFKIGDEIYCRLAVGRTGTMREYTFANSIEMARKPASLSWTDAAATPLSALTAWQGLFHHGTLDKRALLPSSPSASSTTSIDEARTANKKLRVLITGASGGVGSWAVQFASAAGAGAVVGLCSAAQIPAVLALGASEAIDYAAPQQNLAEWVAVDPQARAFDLVVDNVGGSTLAACWHAVRDGGVLLSIVGDPEAARPQSASASSSSPSSAKTLAKAAWYLVEPSGSDLADISRLVDEGKCRPTVDSVYELEDFAAAFDKVESGRPKGKVIIKVGA
jgi:NADPH:quinone reductase-like Zn-dependent oxidoreductase